MTPIDCLCNRSRMMPAVQRPIQIKRGADHGDVGEGLGTDGILKFR